MWDDIRRQQKWIQRCKFWNLVIEHILLLQVCVYIVLPKCVPHFLSEHVCATAQTFKWEFDSVSLLGSAFYLQRRFFTCLSPPATTTTLSNTHTDVHTHTYIHKFVSEHTCKASQYERKDLLLRTLAPVHMWELLLLHTEYFLSQEMCIHILILIIIHVWLWSVTHLHCSFCRY